MTKKENDYFDILNQVLKEISFGNGFWDDISCFETVIQYQTDLYI
jgi:hypothetical protein